MTDDDKKNDQHVTDIPSYCIVIGYGVPCPSTSGTLRVGVGDNYFEIGPDGVLTIHGSEPDTGKLIRAATASVQFQWKF